MGRGTPSHGAKNTLAWCEANPVRQNPRKRNPLLPLRPRAGEGESDGFSGCGCEWCDEPACWPDEEEDDGWDEELDEPVEARPPHRPAPLVCEWVTP